MKLNIALIYEIIYNIVDINYIVKDWSLCLWKGLMDRPDLYEMIIYVFYYIFVVFELLLFSFADSSVLPHADDPQVRVIFII